jgi:hypothetical protein
VTDVVAGAGAAASTPVRKERSPIRAVAVPVEHGGWGLTAEPVVLGLIVSPTLGGLAIGLAAVLAFLARTPLKVALVDAHRNRTLARTTLAWRVFGVELLAILALAGLAAVRGEPWFWWPLAVAAPILGTELVYDMRSRGRRLLPELAGAIGIGSVAAAIALAGGRSTTVAVAIWLVLGARGISAIVTVRDQVGGLHGKARNSRNVLFADLVAVAVVVGAGALEPRVVPGVVALFVAIGVQRLLGRRPTPRAVVLGLRQTGLGLAVVLATAIGVLLT